MSKIDRILELTKQRNDITTELITLLKDFSSELGDAPTPTTRKTAKCKTCGQEGHRSNTCPSKPQE
ncbi:MAG: hypothetical protein AAB403_13110 [Planctomycetota bacterium]